MTTQTALRKAPSERTKIELSVSPQRVAYRRRGATINICSPSERAKTAGINASNMASIRKNPAIQPTDALITGSAGTEPGPLLSAHVLQVATTLGLLEGTPEAASSSLIPGDGDASLSVSATAVASVESAAKPTKPRAKRRKTALLDVPVPIEKLKYLTVAQAAMRYPAFTQKAIRHLVASGEAYQNFPKAGLKSNGGFINCIVRPAGQRKVIINADKFELWLSSFSTQ